MAKYTTQVRTLVEAGYEIFDFDYPIFDEDYRGVLETNIINHYYFREIGFETVGQFKHFLKTWMQLNMPYYNRFYETEFLITKDDYMINLDNTTERTIQKNEESENNTNLQGNRTNEQTSIGASTGESESSGSSTAESESANTGRTVFSDTPQARLQGSDDYATNLTDVDDSGTTSQTGTSTESSTSGTTSNETTTGEELNTETVTAAGTLTTIEQYTEHFLGNASMRYNADILEEWRNTWKNIDMMIIKELNQFFMNIY